MSKRIIVATFRKEADLFAGVAAARERNLHIVDAYTPYAVHGLDTALGWKPSRLTWACAALGISAAAFMTWFQHWTSTVSWPINIGGKPWNSILAFAPVIFESMVLCAGLGTVFVFFVVARLYPGKNTPLVAKGVTDDRFALVVEHGDAELNPRQLRETFADCNAEVDERAPDQPRAPVDRGASGRGWLGALNVGLLVVLVVLVAANVFAPRDTTKPNWEVFSEMVRSPAPTALSENQILPGGLTQQTPPAGTIARGSPPLHFDDTETGAVAAGEQLVNPFAADQPGVIPRGEEVFQNYCVACHGAAGNADGPVVKRGFPPPPSFAVGKSRDMKDGQLFHILTHGVGNMPAHAGLIDRDDRWKVVLFVRQLQALSTATASESSAPQESGDSQP